MDLVPTLKSPILRYFEWDHLPEKPGSVSRLFWALSHTLEVVLPDSDEKSVALRKLLESKDAAVRAAMDIP